MNHIAIITESASNLPQELIEQYPIHVLPIWLTWEGEALRDGIDITAEEVYNRIETGDIIPTTSTFNASELVAILENLPPETEAAIAILLSGELSMSVNVASLVAQSSPPVPLHVVDSRTATMAQGFIVLETARAAAAGATVQQALAVAREMVDRVHFLCVLETFKYLRRGGRVGIAPYYLGETLQIKPIIALQPGIGEVKPAARPRTWHKAVDQMLEMIGDIVGEQPLHAAVSHGNRRAEAERVAGILRQRFDVRELFINHLTPVMGAHAGPLVGVAFFTGE